MHITKTHEGDANARPTDVTDRDNAFGARLQRLRARTAAHDRDAARRHIRPSCARHSECRLPRRRSASCLHPERWRGSRGDLLRNGYDVTFIRDATREQTSRAVEQLESKVRPGSTVFVWFGGYGVQSRGTNYLLPADSAIWVEGDVRTCGLDLSGLLSELQQRGAVKRIALVDASRRNPFERRFRSYSHGLAPMPGSSDELIGFALPPNVVADDVPATHGPFGTSLLGALNPSSSQTDSGAVDVPAAVAAEITADRVFSPKTAARNASSTSGKDASS
jgi:Caspase domain